MTIEEAREELPFFGAFRIEACRCCTANDWYCPSDCAMLKKASKMDFDRILKSYARNDGDMSKVFRYINQVRI